MNRKLQLGLLHFDGIGNQMASRRLRLAERLLEFNDGQHHFRSLHRFELQHLIREFGRFLESFGSTQHIDQHRRDSRLLFAIFKRLQLLQ